MKIDILVKDNKNPTALSANSMPVFAVVCASFKEMKAIRSASFKTADTMNCSKPRSAKHKHQQCHKTTELKVQKNILITQQLISILIIIRLINPDTNTHMKFKK